MAQFDKDGYLIVRGLLTPDEVTKITAEVEREDGVRKFAFRRDDGAGGKSQMALWNMPGEGVWHATSLWPLNRSPQAARSACPNPAAGDDLTGHVSRNVRIVESMEKLLHVAAPNELYHYHTKLIMKDASEGPRAGKGSGRFAWHMDYGYW